MFYSIKINGKSYDRHTLVQLSKYKLSNQATEEWERNVYLFIEELLSDLDFISVISSGSTSREKQLKLYKRELVESAKRTQKYFNLSSEGTALLCLPVKYIAGKMMIVRAFVTGFNLLVTRPVSDPFQNIDEPIDFSAVTPYQLHSSLNSLQIKKNIKTIIVGGAPVSVDLKKRIQQLPTSIYETYGMTETCSHIAIKPLNGKLRSDDFKVLTGINISTDERDCLVIDMGSINKKTITNDIVSTSGDSFKWLGRYDNIINTGGIKIIPEEIENRIAEIIPYNFVISFLPDNKLNQKVILLLETEELPGKRKEELENQLKKILQGHELPKDILCIPNFVRTPNGKIQRKQTMEIILKHVN